MSDNEPVAWAIVGADKDAVLDSHLYHTEAVATRWANQHGDRVVPLYRSPTLTDEEREAVELAADVIAECEDDDGEPLDGVALTLRGILDRLK